MVAATRASCARTRVARGPGRDPTVVAPAFVPGRRCSLRHPTPAGVAQKPLFPAGLLDPCRGPDVCDTRAPGINAGATIVPSLPGRLRTRVYQASAIENNVVVGCTGSGITIGDGDTPGSAAAWSPFDNPFGGNPIVPVGHNLVFGCGTAFAGDDWYWDGYDDVLPPELPRYGELTLDPQ